jgi:hypothetical protein
MGPQGLARGAWAGIPCSRSKPRSPSQGAATCLFDVAQIGAFIGATMLLLIAAGIVMVIANTIEARVGG